MRRLHLRYCYYAGAQFFDREGFWRLRRDADKSTPEAPATIGASHLWQPVLLPYQSPQLFKQLLMLVAMTIICGAAVSAMKIAPIASRFTRLIGWLLLIAKMYLPSANVAALFPS